MNQELSCVYKATTKKGEVAHFGEYSSAKAWAGWGKVEQVPLKTLTLIEKPAKPCGMRVVRRLETFGDDRLVPPTGIEPVSLP